MTESEGGGGTDINNGQSNPAICCSAECSDLDFKSAVYLLVRMFCNALAIFEHVVVN